MDGEKQGWNCLLLIVCIAMTIGVSIPAGFCFSALNGNVEVRRVGEEQGYPPYFVITLVKKRPGKRRRGAKTLFKINTYWANRFCRKVGNEQYSENIIVFSFCFIVNKGMGQGFV